MKKHLILLSILLICFFKKQAFSQNSASFIFGYGPNYSFLDKNQNTAFGYIFMAGLEKEFNKNRKQFYLAPSIFYVNNCYITKIKDFSQFRTYQEGLQINLLVGFDNKNKLSLKTGIFFLPIFGSSHAGGGINGVPSSGGLSSNFDFDTYFPNNLQAGYQLAFSLPIYKRIALDSRLTQNLIPVVKDDYYLNSRKEILLISQKSYSTSVSFGIKYNINKQKKEE